MLMSLGFGNVPSNRTCPFNSAAPVVGSEAAPAFSMPGVERQITKEKQIAKVTATSQETFFSRMTHLDSAFALSAIRFAVTAARTPS